MLAVRSARRASSNHFLELGRHLEGNKEVLNKSKLLGTWADMLTVVDPLRLCRTVCSNKVFA